MPIAPRLTKAKRATFLARLAVTANVSASCADAKVPRYIVYSLKRRDPDFAKAWDNALELAVDALEAEVLRRAIEGDDTEQFYGGKSVGTVKHYSDRLAMFLLKSKRPDIYGDIKAVSETDAAAIDDETRYEQAYQRLLDALNKRRATPDAGAT